MKVALLSIAAGLSFEKRMESIEMSLKLSAQNGCDLSLLPELSFCGYTDDLSILKRYSFDEALIWHSKLAAKYSIAIGFGTVDDGAKMAKNCYTVVDASGKLLCRYEKIHIFSYGKEDLIFEAGERLAFFELDGVNFGVAICYDLRFAEMFSIYSKSCDAVILPAAWPKERIGDYKALIRARAIENRAWMLGINWRGGKYSKSSLVVKQDGSFEKPTFSSATVDIYEILSKKLPDNMPNNLKDKRFELYAKFYGQLS